MGKRAQKNGKEPVVLGVEEQTFDAAIESVCANGANGSLSIEELRRLSVVRKNIDVLSGCDVRIPALVSGGALAHSEHCDDGAIPVCAGAHVSLDERGYFVAERYGYAHIEDHILSIASPLVLSADNMQVHWLLLDERALPVAENMLEPWLDDMGVVSGLDEGLIKKTAAQIRRGTHGCGSVLAASGTPAIAGAGAKVEIALGEGRKAGVEREDGTLNFREVNSVTPIVRDQVIARRTPARVGRAGLTVCGAVVDAEEFSDEVLKAGENVQVNFVEGVEVYVATAAGALLLTADEVAIGRLLHINGHVDFHTGNLDFDGVLMVDGSVLAGFSVKATGDIQIAGSLEPGTTVRAGGDLFVDKGILGRRTKASAVGDVQARYVQEATVVAGGDLYVKDLVYQARLRVGGQINVARGSGPRGGSIIGGEAWGQSISLFVAGSPAHVVTSLMAGMDPESVRKLDKIREAVDLTYAQLRRLLNRFDLNAIDIEQIQNRISATTGPKRKLLAQTARQLGGVVQSHQKLLAARRELELRLGDRVKDASIIVRDIAYSGVEVRIGEHKMSLREDVGSPRFHVEDNGLVAH